MSNLLCEYFLLAIKCNPLQEPIKSNNYLYAYKKVLFWEEELREDNMNNKNRHYVHNSKKERTIINGNNV